MPLIELPDGHTAEFPENMSMDDIKSVIQKKYPPTGQSQINQPSQTGNMVNTFLGQMPIPKPGFFRPTEKDINQLTMAGVPGGRIIKPLLEGAESLPVIGNALQQVSSGLSKYPLMNKLMSVLGTGTEGAAIGAATDPEDRTRGALTGFGLGSGIHGLGSSGKYLYGAGKKAYGNVKNIFNEAAQEPVQQELPPAPVLPEMQKLPPPILPEIGKLPDPQLPIRPALPELKLPEAASSSSILQEHVPTAPIAGNELLQKLGQGATNKEEASTKLASLMREKYDQRVAESGQFFDFPLKQAGNEKLYERVDPLITTAMDKEKSMLGQLKGLNVGTLYENFKNSPTINNAHLLKSELGSVIGDLEKNTAKTADDRATIARINSVRKRLENDINDAFERHDKNSNYNLAPMYQRGVKFYKENVAPYLSSPEIREITRNRVETPKNIENIFNTPTNFDKEGKSTIGPINKILSDLPSEAKDLVLFNKIGASKNINNHDKLLNDLISAKNEGYSSYFNPHVNEAMKDIANKSKKDALNKESIDLSNKESIKQKELEYKNAVSQAKAEHARRTSEIKNEHAIATKNALLQHKNLIKDIESLHKANIKNALLEHKSSTRALEQQHKLATTKAKLEHKVATDKVKMENALNQKKVADAKFKRNVLIGSGIGAASVALGGGSYIANKINSLRNVLGSD